MRAKGTDNGAGGAHALPDGAVVNGYQVRRFLGKGAYGEVYEVWHSVMAAAFALKIFSPRDREDVARLLVEVRSLAKVRHPNVITIHQFGEHEGHPYFIMDLGEPITEELDETECRRFVDDICAALTALHAAGIVHRDVKPANVLKRDGRYLLADFGIAKSEQATLPKGLENPSLCAQGKLWVGTPGFIAPEVYESEDATPSSDVFALAATCLELCPKLKAHDRVLSVLTRALAARRELRYQTVQEFAAAFGAAFERTAVAERLEILSGFAIILAILLGVLWFFGVWPFSERSGTKSGKGVSAQIEAYAQEMTNLEMRIRAKQKEILGPFKGTKPWKTTSGEELDAKTTAIVDAQTRFHDETQKDKERYNELLKRSAMLKLNGGLPLTAAEAASL